MLLFENIANVRAPRPNPISPPQFVVCIITSKCNPEKDSYLNDGGGLRLRLRKNQTKYWEFRYKIQGKEIVRPFGSYPVITLKKARDMRMEAKLHIQIHTVHITFTQHHLPPAST